LLIPTALIVFRHGSYKELAAALIGFLLPLWLLYGIYYLVCGHVAIQPAVFSIPKSLNFEFFHLERSVLLILIFPTLIGLFSLLFVTGRLRQLNTNHRLSFLLLIVSFLISIIQIILYPEEWYRLYPLLSILIAVPVSFYLNNTRQKFIREIVFDLLILFIASNYLLFYFEYL
jgi:hypothetical protein